MRRRRILEKCRGHWPVTCAFLISQTSFVITNMIVALELACENSRPCSLLARVSEEGRLFSQATLEYVHIKHIIKLLSFADLIQWEP